MVLYCGSIWGFNCMIPSGKVKTRVPLLKAWRAVVPFIEWIP